MKILAFLGAFFFSFGSLSAQSGWSALFDLEVEETTDGELSPKFSEEILALDGQYIELDVEVLENRLRDDYIILYAEGQKDLCTGFDVGRAAETPANEKLSPGKIYLVRGKLSLNASNRDALIYQLSDLQIINEH